MEPTATMSAAPASSLEPESVAVRTRQLAAARRRATALLAGVTVLFVAVTGSDITAAPRLANARTMSRSLTIPSTEVPS